MEQLKIDVPETRHKAAWIYAIKELTNYKAKNSLQNKGILYFDININMPDNAKLGMSASEVSKTLLQTTKYKCRQKISSVHN